MSTRGQSEMRGLVTAGRCFESEWTAGLGSSVNPLRGNMFAHSTDAGHSETLADTFGLLIWTSVGPLQSGMTANDQHQPASSRAIAALATTGRFLR